MITLDGIGTKIRKLRMSKGMPLWKLSRILGIDQSTLSKIERGERKANPRMIAKIANTFHIDKNILIVSYYSDLIASKIEKEDYYIDILEVAKAKIKHKRYKNS